MTSASVQGSKTTPGISQAPVNVFFRYPNDRILSNIRLERLIMFWVWLVVPVQYYVFTRLPGGPRADELFSMALAVSLSMLLVILLGAVVALVPSKQIGMNYSERVRAWSLAILTNWSASVSLLAASYGLAACLLKDRNRDLIQILLCHRDAPVEAEGWRALSAMHILRCADFPRVLSTDTYIIYLVYSSLALFLVLGVVVAWTRGNQRRLAVPAPRTMFVPLLTAAVLCAMYGVTKILLSPLTG